LIDSCPTRLALVELYFADKLLRDVQSDNVNAQVVKKKLERLKTKDEESSSTGDLDKRGKVWVYGSLGRRVIPHRVGDYW